MGSPEPESKIAHVIGKMLPHGEEVPKKKMSRQKARLARRDAAAAQMRAEAEQEAQLDSQQGAADEARALQQVCQELGVVVHEIEPDGHW